MRDCCLVVHADVVADKDKPAAEAQFKRICAAYEVRPTSASSTRQRCCHVQEGIIDLYAVCLVHQQHTVAQRGISVNVWVLDTSYHTCC
jgi:hypothetical protein